MEMKYRKKKLYVPIWEKATLSVDEAAAYSGIGINKLREITNEEDCNFVFWVGKRKMLKRKRFEEYIAQMYSI